MSGWLDLGSGRRVYALQRLAYDYDEPGNITGSQRLSQTTDLYLDSRKLYPDNRNRKLACPCKKLFVCVYSLRSAVYVTPVQLLKDLALDRRLPHLIVASAVRDST